jgi:hypothetical protein
LGAARNRDHRFIENQRTQHLAALQKIEQHWDSIQKHDQSVLDKTLAALQLFRKVAFGESAENARPHFQYATVIELLPEAKLGDSPSMRDLEGYGSAVDQTTQKIHYSVESVARRRGKGVA